MPTLICKIADRSAHESVIGLGYVGLPLAIEFARAGYRVTGIDGPDSAILILQLPLLSQIIDLPLPRRRHLAFAVCD